MASFTVPCPKCLSPAHLGLSSQNSRGQTQKMSFQGGFSLKSFGSSVVEPASSGVQCLNRKQFSGLKCQAKLNEAVVAENPSNSVPVLVAGSEDASPKENDNLNGKVSGPSAIPDASSISAFMTQVSDLIKLVDSRDIAELRLKQSDCELTIRKKEALQPPPAPVPPPMHYHTLPLPPPPAPASVSAPASPPPSKAPLALPSPAKANTSSHPPLKCPMAGTFYRSPAPGEPPFVKVGDKVQKGQVVCIIEAMKLMNEIEADKSGTVVEILVDDTKPVSIDMPLLVIAP
ncbi:hypothetical protein L6164_006737 [Bauhinia variegata]|uniref:Uncharacterized protein n=1 Tax=Bauhinia variegata TaxID=167791 RepID=A0ACB9PVD6_BAUVA|nr:hypothetical protein L6164_006737 [Bauhinia variegata]